MKRVESAFWRRATMLGGAGVLQCRQRWALLRADWILEISCCEAKPHHACEASVRKERRVALSTELSSLAASPLVLRTRRANIFGLALLTRLSTCSVTQSLELMVTPSIFKLLTLGRPGV